MINLPDQQIDRKRLNQKDLRGNDFNTRVGSESGQPQLNKHLNEMKNSRNQTVMNKTM